MHIPVNYPKCTRWAYQLYGWNNPRETHAFLAFYGGPITPFITIVGARFVGKDSIHTEYPTYLKTAYNPFNKYHGHPSKLLHLLRNVQGGPTSYKWSYNSTFLWVKESSWNPCIFGFFGLFMGAPITPIAVGNGEDSIDHTHGVFGVGLGVRLFFRRLRWFLFFSNVLSAVIIFSLRNEMTKKGSQHGLSLHQTVWSICSSTFVSAGDCQNPGSQSDQCIRFYEGEPS